MRSTIRQNLAGKAPAAILNSNNSSLSYESAGENIYIMHFVADLFLLKRCHAINDIEYVFVGLGEAYNRSYDLSEWSVHRTRRRLSPELMRRSSMAL